MRLRSFRYCMLIGAAALLSVSLYYLLGYVGVAIALNNSGIQPFYQQSIRAMWLAFGFQAFLMAVLYAVVAWRPRAVSRAVIVICGLLQLVEAVLQLSLSGSAIAMAMLSIAAIFVLIGSTLWPKAIDMPKAVSNQLDAGISNTGRP
jgi:hypothetical protein